MSPQRHDLLSCRGNTTRRLDLALLLVSAVFLTGCRQQMAEQPSYRPLRPSSFFADGRSARPFEQGVIPRGRIYPDTPIESGRVAKPTEAGEAAKVVAAGASGPNAAMAAATPHTGAGSYLSNFPVPVDGPLLERGRERYTIFCAVCHDLAGTGNGMIVQRGYVRPPSLVADNSRGYALRGIKMALPDAPVGYIFDVITNGHGAMPEYAAQIPPRDRWAITAYVRALQLSRNSTLANLPAEEQNAFKQAVEAAANQSKGEVTKP